MKQRQIQDEEKKLKRPHSLKKHQSHLNLLKQMTQARKDDKGKKIPPLLGLTGE